MFSEVTLNYKGTIVSLLHHYNFSFIVCLRRVQLCSSILFWRDNAYGKWSPEPNFMMTHSGFPRLVVEVCSDEKNESDRWRMLIYAASLVRIVYEVWNAGGEMRQMHESFDFVLVAIYMIGKTAEVYLLGQGEEVSKDSQVCYQLLCNQFKI